MHFQLLLQLLCLENIEYSKQIPFTIVNIEKELISTYRNHLELRLYITKSDTST
jgi:hypothetical protein